MNNLIAVTIGDIDGIGIEILINLWEKKKINNFVLFTNVKIFKNYLVKQKIKLNIKIFDDTKIDKKFFYIFDFEAKNKYLNTYKSLTISYEVVKKLGLAGIITLPLSKELIIKKIDKKFTGQTELYQRLDKKKYSNMMFINKNLIIVTLTNHIRLKNVIRILSDTKKIYNKIKLINETLINDFNIRKPQLIIAGINPHASENSTIGNEENLIIKPMIKKLNQNNINIKGPYSADSLVNKKNKQKFDVFIFNYHDQALIPFKLISNNTGINYTGGLDIIRVSPDHGTAYDIVGKNLANTSSLINCFKFLNRISKNRSANC